MEKKESLREAFDEQVEEDLKNMKGKVSPNRPLNSMTVGEFAAIHLRSPISGTEWLDKFIAKLTTTPSPNVPSRSPFPDDAICLFRESDHWCCVGMDFLNLQESIAGFGLSISNAVHDYIKNGGKV